MTAVSEMLGVLKMLKPFKFTKTHAHWSDGFRQHGVFSIEAKHRTTDGDWICSIRRIATCRECCPLGELYNIRESYLVENSVYTDLECFK